MSATALRRTALLGLLAALTACGGGGGGSASPPPPVTPPPPPPVGNRAPEARLAAPATSTAGEVLALDAGASTDADGDPLVYSWDFGDGSRGGMAAIAHAYAAAGDYTVRLTVTDPQGAQGTASWRVQVAAAPAPARRVAVAGRVLDLAGQPLAGARVTDGTTTATTGADGRVAFTVGTAVDVTLRVSLDGHADQVKTLRLPAATGTDASFEAVLMPRPAALTLPDAAAGGTLRGSDGAAIVLPPGALVDAAGNAVAGAVQVTMAPVDVTGGRLAAFPGRFEGVLANGQRSPIATYGSTEYTLTQGGRPLQLRAGARATLELPVYSTQRYGGGALAAGQTLPLWSLDEATGLWIAEGQGEVVASGASPTGWAMRATVGHLSWWNVDSNYVPYKPRPRCINDVPGQYDSLFEQATICKMLAEMDKPIPPQGATKRAQAAAVRLGSPVVRLEADLPIAGGVDFPVPADYDVLINASALNGTWQGQARTRGAAGAGAELVIPLRPVDAGISGELLALPFDGVRSIGTATTRYRVAVTAGQGLVVSAQASQSTLEGVVQLRDAAGTLLAQARFGPDTGSIEFRFDSAGEAVLELVPTANAPGAYRLNVATTSVPARLPTTLLGDRGDGALPQVAVNAAGTQVAAWVETVSFTPTLRSSRYGGAAGGWSAPVTVASAPGLNTTVGLQLALDDAGNATLAWDATGGPFAARADAAGTWNAAQALAAGCSGGLSQRLAVQPSGAALVAWQRGGGTAGLCARRWSGTAWAALQTLDTSAAATGAQLVLAANAAGDAVLAWQADAGRVAAVRLAAAGGFASPVVLAATSAAMPAATLADSGDALVGWAAGGQQLAAWWPASEAPRSAVAVGAVSASGGSFLLWSGGTRFWSARMDGSGPVVTRFDPATGWGSAVRPAAGQLAVMANASASADGQGVIVWAASKPSGIGNNLGFARLDGSGAWVASPALLSNQPLMVTDGTRLLPATVGLATGGGQVGAVWRDADPGAITSTLRGTRIPALP